MNTLSTRIVVALIAVMALSSCANTIRGAGEDVHQTTHAVKRAAQ